MRKQEEECLLNLDHKQERNDFSPIKSSNMLCCHFLDTNHDWLKKTLALINQKFFESMSICSLPLPATF